LTIYRGRFQVFNVVDSQGQYPFVRAVIRPSNSSGFIPVYCHATAITGMSMFGKISVGVREDHYRAQNQNEYGKDDECYTAGPERLEQSTYLELPTFQS